MARRSSACSRRSPTRSSASSSTAAPGSSSQPSWSPRMAENDKILLRRYHKHGDLAAREQLIEQYMSLVRSLARRYAYRGEQLDDLVPGRAYSSLSLNTGGGSDEDGELDPLESIGTEEHQYAVSEDRAVLAPGFRALDERERMILHLRFFEGLTQSQIAQQVGISQMHVSRLIRRSLEKIREEIASDEELPDETEAARRRRVARG